MAENFMSMVELAKSNGIRVVLASVTAGLRLLHQTRPDCGRKAKSSASTAGLKIMPRESGSVYLDYYSALADGREFQEGI